MREMWYNVTKNERVTNMEIGKNIKIKRLEKGYSLEHLAKMANTSRQTIHRYENGIISNIPSNKIELLASALGTTPAYLMGWEGEQALSSESDKLIQDIIEILKDCSTEQLEQIYNFIKVMCKKD